MKIIIVLNYSSIGQLLSKMGRCSRNNNHSGIKIVDTTGTSVPQLNSMFTIYLVSFWFFFYSTIKSYWLQHYIRLWFWVRSMLPAMWKCIAHNPYEIIIFKVLFVFIQRNEQKKIIKLFNDSSALYVEWPLSF